MADANPTGSGSSTSTSPGAATTRPVRRRKVRKGTQSCWECKRRKIRCTFASPGVHAVCDGCKSRGTRCVGQEYEDEPAPVTVAADRRADRPRLSRHESVQQDESQHTSDLNSTVTKHPVPDPSSSSSVALGLDARSSAELSRHLLSLWPSEPDVDRILAAQANTSFLLHGIVCQPYEGYFARHHGSWLRRSCLQRPADGTHPVLVARSMLMLVTLLDGLPAAGGGGGDDTAGEALKERLYSAAAKLVTANHELPPSLEGIESHLMEVMHLANRGNLRRAWLVNRRAVSLAQMMGLHAATTSGSSSRSSSSVAALHPSTRARVRPDYAWFRLVFTDRHLSLLLGLPQATTDNEAFAARGVLEAHPPLERFERVMGVACSLILQRNAVSASSSSGDLDTTYEIDRTLQRAAALLTPQWWLVSPADRLAGHDEAAFAETTRLMNQFIYHHLLVQLHLPYVLACPSSSGSDPRVDCSKMTVAGASRAILARFVAFHASPASVSYCRAIDFFAFIASTTLCLVHIEAARRCHHHHQHGGGGGGGGGGDLLRPLLHERHADRAVMQGLLDVVGRMSSTGPDPIARRIERILGPLLEIEANASRGGCYSVSAVEGEAGAEGGGGKQEEAAAGAPADFGDSSDAPRVLRIKIPFFGTIRIEHHPEWSASASPGYARGEDQQVGAAPAARSGCDGDVSSGGSVANDAQLAQQNASSAMSSNTLETDWTGAGAMSEHVSSLMPKNDDWTHNSTGLYPGDGSEPYLFVPDLSSDEHWALQGVDIALFSNLTQGS